ILAGLPFEARYRGVSNALTDELKAELWSAASLNGEGDIAQFFAPYYEMVNHTGRLNQMLFVDTKVWLPDDLLIKADKMTMANSVELRVPFLDHRLVEFAARLPVGYKLRGRESKYLLKKAMEPHHPREVIYLSKMGFPL